MTICLDASIIVKFLVYESGSDNALEWLNSHDGEEFVAPAFFPAEVASVLQRRVRKGEVTFEERDDAFDILESMQIRSVWDFDLIRRAIELADRISQPTIYDTVYLAVAEREQCSLMTADERFVAAASSEYPLMRLLK